MSVEQIAGEVARLLEGAASNKLQPPDLADGTITVSNIGAIGGTYAMPLVNGREVAIVALGRSGPLPSLLLFVQFVFRRACCAPSIQLT